MEDPGDSVGDFGGDSAGDLVASATSPERHLVATGSRSGLLPSPPPSSSLYPRVRCSTFPPPPSPQKPGDLFRDFILENFHSSVCPSGNLKQLSFDRLTPLWIVVSPNKPNLNSLSIKNILNFWFSSFSQSFWVVDLGLGLFRTYVISSNVAATMIVSGSSILKQKGISLHLSV